MLRTLGSMVVVVSVGCSARASDTSVRGSVGSGFPADVQSVVVRDESGHARVAALSADKHFAVSLPRGHRYSVSAVTATGEIPVVFPRTGHVDTAFRVSSRGGRVDMGSLRYFSSAPVTGFQTSGKATSGKTADCVDCVDDNEQVECEDGTEGEQSNDNQVGEFADTHQPMSVGEHNAPSDINGCDNEDDGDNNDEH